MEEEEGGERMEQGKGWKDGRRRQRQKEKGRKKKGEG